MLEEYGGIQKDLTGLDSVFTFYDDWNDVLYSIKSMFSWLLEY
jgi:hypothetical protein